MASGCSSCSRTGGPCSWTLLGTTARAARGGAAGPDGGPPAGRRWPRALRAPRFRHRRSLGCALHAAGVSSRASFAGRLVSYSRSAMLASLARRAGPNSTLTRRHCSALIARQLLRRLPRSSRGSASLDRTRPSLQAPKLTPAAGLSARAQVQVPRPAPALSSDAGTLSCCWIPRGGCPGRPWTSRCGGTSRTRTRRAGDLHDGVVLLDDRDPDQGRAMVLPTADGVENTARAAGAGCLSRRSECGLGKPLPPHGAAARRERRAHRERASNRARRSDRRAFVLTVPLAACAACGGLSARQRLGQASVRGHILFGAEARRGTALRMFSGSPSSAAP